MPFIDICNFTKAVQWQRDKENGMHKHWRYSSGVLLETWACDLYAADLYAV